MERRKLFDPGDPFDAMAESFRRQTIDLALGALRGATYRDMDGHSQIECLIAGVLTGLVGACMARVDPKDWNAIVELIQVYLPESKQIAICALEQRTPNGNDGIPH